MSESRMKIRRLFAEGFTSRWSGSRVAAPRWVVDVEWGSTPMARGRGWASNFLTDKRQQRMAKLAELEAAEKELAAVQERRENAKDDWNALERPNRSDFAKGPKGEVAFEQQKDAVKRVSDKLSKRYGTAARQVGIAETKVRKLRSEIEGPALAELRHERKLVEQLRKAANERLELLDAGIGVFEADLQNAEVTGPKFGENELDRVLRAFAGHRSDANWFLAKCKGKLSELGHAIRERVA